MEAHGSGLLLGSQFKQGTAETTRLATGEGPVPLCALSH